jgi:protein tyrosine/serine phosphatase
MSAFGKLPGLHVAALLLSLSVAAPAAAQTIRTAPLANVALDLKNIKIDNFGRIDDGYYRGAMPKGADFKALASLGVKTMIDLTDDDGNDQERELVERAGMKFVKIPMTTHVVPTPAEMGTFLSIVNDPANLPVYVHCVGGRHRTGVMTAVYRMTQKGWSPQQAFKEMKQYKFGADFLHPEFKKFVLAFNPSSVMRLGVPAAAAN